MLTRKLAKAPAKKGKGKRGNNNLAVHRDLMESTRLTSNMVDSHDNRDLFLKPPNQSLDAVTIPRNYISLPFFRKCSYQKVVAYSGGGLENPIALLLTDFGLNAFFIGAFDQYGFFAASVSVSLADVLFSGSISQDSLKYGSAIDFDNVGTGYGPSIERYGNVQITALTPYISQTREWKPTSKPLMQGTGGTRSSAIAREWIDSSYSDIPHMGYKGYLYADSFASANLTVVVSAIIGFRNAI